MEYILASIILLIVVWCILTGLGKISKMKIKNIFILVFFGILLLVLLQGCIYSIGKSLKIDLFFFEITFVGKNIFYTFEKNYIESISNLGYTNPIFYQITSLIIPAIIEECGKLFMLIRYQKKYTISSIGESVYAIIFIAIGFSCVESLGFLYQGYTSGMNQELYTLWFMRGALSTISHIFFSAIVGYYYGKSLFAGFTIIDNGGITRYIKLLKFIRKITMLPIMSIRSVYSLKLILTGLIMSISIHIVYNLCISVYSLFLWYAIIVFGGILFWYFLLHEKKNGYNYREIHDRINFLKKKHNINSI